jgi:hypothetical protein
LFGFREVLVVIMMLTALVLGWSMGAFWSRKKLDEGFGPVPEWAGFFTPERYARFQREIQRHFQRNEIACRIEDGFVFVFQGGDPEPRYRWGLLNLAQVCNQSPDKEWPEHIRGHFDAMARSEQEHAQLEAQMGDFAAIRERLGVRLGPPDMPRDLMIWREDIPGVLSYIVIDLPSSMVTVNGDALSRWGISSQQLFDMALENLRKQGRPDVTRFEMEKDLALAALLGDSFFTASQALLLAENTDLVGPQGSLVAVPHRHALLCYPIRDLNVLRVVHVLWTMAQGMHKEGPGSISGNIYWYFEGKFTAIPCEIEDDAIGVRPPEDFEQMLNSLKEPEAPKPG